MLCCFSLLVLFIVFFFFVLSKDKGNVWRLLLNISESAGSATIYVPLALAYQ